MFKGVNASDGFGIGVAQVAVAPDVSFTPVAPEDPEKEKQRYEAALEKFVAQTNAQIERMKVSVGEEAALIMGAHIEFAEDEGIHDTVNSSIDAGMCAEQAVSEAYNTYYTMFSQMDDELFRERATDVADVKTGLLADLLGKEVVDLSTLPENSIIVVKELTPSMKPIASVRVPSSSMKTSAQANRAVRASSATSSSPASTFALFAASSPCTPA